MDIEAFLSRHGYIAIFIALLLEEMGFPMPIPTDVLVVLIGYQLRIGALNPLLAFTVMQIGANIGASVLYFVVRQGGRPLVERFGRYVHLKPEHLERSERWIDRMGWWGIVIGRAIPGVRYATVISCGLFRVPFWRFLTAQILGTSINMTAFLALGWIFGPTVVAYIHLPQAWIRSLVLLLIALGLPVLVFWLYRRSGGRVAAAHTPAPSRRRRLAADVLVGFIGAIEVTCVWSAMTLLVAEFTGALGLSAGAALSSWLQGRGIYPIASYALIYGSLVLLCIAISLLYHELPLEQRLPHVGRVAVLAVASQLLVALVLMLALLVQPPPQVLHWWSANSLAAMLAVVLSLIGYAIIAVYGHILAVRALPASPWSNRPVSQNGREPAEVVAAALESRQIEE